MALNTLARGSLVLALALSGAPALADTLEREFDVAAGGILVLDTEPGSVDIRTGGRGIRVEVVRTGQRADEFDVRFEQSADRLEVRGRWPDVLSSWRSRPKARIEYRITVPEAFNLDLSTSGGSIKVADLAGEVRARTSGGSIRLGQIQGEVDADTSGGSIVLDGGGSDARLETSGGSIRVGEVQGTLYANTSGGSIRVDGVAGNVTAKTSGGSVDATLRGQPTGECLLSTSGGTVTLQLPDNIAVDIDASSSGGRVSSDLPLDNATMSKRRIRGSLNGGGPLVRLKSSGGGVRIRRLN